MAFHVQLGPMQAVAVLDPAAQPALDAILKQANRAAGSTGGLPDVAGISSYFDLDLVDGNGRQLSIRFGQSTMRFLMAVGIVGFVLFVLALFAPKQAQAGGLLAVMVVGASVAALWMIERIWGALALSLAQRRKPPAPDENTLRQLKEFTVRRAKRLRRIFGLQLCFLILTYLAALGVLGWGFQRYAESGGDIQKALAPSGFAFVFLTVVVWVPFQKALVALRVADSLDVMALGFVAQLETIALMPDPAARVVAQAAAVQRYTSQGLRE